MTKQIYIALADDHRVFADGLASLLQKSDVPIQGIHIATNSSELSAILENNPIDVALVDIEFGKDDGRQVAKSMAQAHPDCKYIALSSHGESGIIKSALKGAFSGYILKTDSLPTIIECIQKVLDGATYISPDSGTHLLNDISGNKNNSSLPKITKREKEVLDCVAKEMSTKEIATHLYISEKTVEAHRSNLMLKLDAKNAAGLIKRAFDNGLLD